MKAIDFFTKRFKQGKIEDDATTKFLATLPAEMEIPDDIDKSLERVFMTADRAKADKDIIGAARAQVYNIIDEIMSTDIYPNLEKVDKTAVVDLSNDKDTLSKLKKLGPVLDKVSIKANGSDSTEKLKEYEKEQEKLLKRIADMNVDFTKKEGDQKKTFEEEKKTLLLDHALKQRLGKVDYAEEHKELRGAIDDVIFAALKKENHLSLNESGEFVVSIMENGIPKPKFNGNTQVTFDQVLEEKVKPYVKKNNSSDGKKEKQKETPKHITQPAGTGLTLAEMRRQQAGG